MLLENTRLITLILSAAILDILIYFFVTKQRLQYAFFLSRGNKYNECQALCVPRVLVSPTGVYCSKLVKFYNASPEKLNKFLLTAFISVASEMILLPQTNEVHFKSGLRETST